MLFRSARSKGLSERIVTYRHVVRNALIPLVAIVGLCIWRGRRTPALLAGFGAYVILVLPVSGLLQTGLQTVAARHAYFAMLPLLLLVGGIVIWVWRRGSIVTRFALSCLLACELCLFGLCTRSLIPVWRNDETLFTVVLKRFPNFAVGHYCLAFTLAHEGRLDEAVGEYEQALRMIPDYAEAHCNLGVALEKLHRTSEAIEQYEIALRIWPEYANAHYNLGLALVRLGKSDEAIRHWEQAVRIDPQFAEAYCNIGTALEQVGRVPEALEYYERALKLKPDLVQARQALARLRATK